MSRFLIVAALVEGAVLTVLLILDPGRFSIKGAIAWLTLVFCFYLASLLVP